MISGDNLFNLLKIQRSALYIYQNLPSTRAREKEVTFRIEKWKLSWEKGKKTYFKIMEIEIFFFFFFA